MKAEDYFQLSRKRKVPMRCPILNRCARRAFTLHQYGHHRPGASEVSFSKELIREGVLPSDFDATCIHLCGETPSFSRDSDNVEYCNLCPEVNLFDLNFALPFASGTASASGEWDKVQGLHSTVERHFTECPEYCKSCLIEPTPSKPTKQRDQVPPKKRFTVLMRDKFTCQYCGRARDSGAILHVDHRVSIYDGGSSDIENLITACDRCNLGKGKQSLPTNDA